MTDSSNVALVKRMVFGASQGVDDTVSVRQGDTIEKRIEGHAEDPSDGAGLSDTLHPDLVVHIPPSMPYGGEHVGYAGFRRMGAAMSRAWNISGELVMRFVDAGEDQVICFVNFSATAQQTGRPLEMRMCEIYTIEDGRIRDIRIFYWDTAEVVAATDGVKTFAVAES
jgi:ketosteroid isomerase-like protein